MQLIIVTDKSTIIFGTMKQNDYLVINIEIYIYDK